MDYAGLRSDVLSGAVDGVSVMSELEALVGDVVPLMGAAVGAYGAGVLARAEDTAAEATVGLGARLLRRVFARAVRPDAVSTAAADLAAAPGDADALAALRLQVRKVLTQDPELVIELAGMVRGLPAVTASGERSVAIGGSNHGSVSTGDRDSFQPR